MVTSRVYTCTTIGASSVTLTALAGGTGDGRPAHLEIGTPITMPTTNATPDANFWTTAGARYKITIDRIG